MIDKYYKTSELKENVLSYLGLCDAEGETIEGVIDGCGGNYYQTPNYILLWVGKIPKTINAETGEVIDYEADGAEHFNVRPLTGYPNFGDMSVTEVEPATPYSIFS